MSELLEFVKNENDPILRIENPSQEELNSLVEKSLIDWNIEVAIEESKKIGKRLKDDTTKFVKEIYIAKTILKVPENKAKFEMDFDGFCKKVGISVSTANRWIRKWKDPEGVAKSKAKSKEDKKNKTIKDNITNAFKQMVFSITQETDEYIEIEIDYCGKVFYEKIKRDLLVK